MHLVIFVIGVDICPRICIIVLDPVNAHTTQHVWHLQGNLLLVGHATGDVVFWEFKRTGWETVKAFKDAHNSPVTSATFVEGNIQLALTGDAQGRLVSHNVTAYLSITAIFAGVPCYDA